MKLAVKHHSGREPTVSVTGTKEDMREIAESISHGLARLEAAGKKEGCLASALPAYGGDVEYLEFHVVADVEPVIQKNEEESKRKAALGPVLFVLGLVVIFFAIKGVIAMLR
jgi:hypothetical protein